MTKAYFTIEVDLPDGVTHEDFRFWAEHELRCAVGGTDADDPLRKLKRDKIIVRSVASPSIGSFYRPENYVVAEEVQSKSRLHRQGETPVKVFKASLKPRWNACAERLGFKK